LVAFEKIRTKLMNKKLVKKVATVTSLAASAVVLSLAGAAPAMAAGSCGTVYYSQSAGGASVSCTAGNYQFRAKVTCNAVWPFTSWTKYSAWQTMTVYAGQSFSFSSSVFPSCPSPATYSTGVQYR
jgi:hypothetical protein